MAITIVSRRDWWHDPETMKIVKMKLAAAWAVYDRRHNTGIQLSLFS